MSAFFSSQIVIQTKQLPPFYPKTKGCQLGNSAMLDKLMPKLAINQDTLGKAQLTLEKIDSYMLEETQMLMERIANICNPLPLRENTQLKISRNNKKLVISGSIADKTELVSLINKDRWIAGAFDWLVPNYIGLAHSQELLQFSYAYEVDRQRAMDKYCHFNQPNQGLECYLSCHKQQGQFEIHWYLESPCTLFKAKSLVTIQRC